MVNHIPIYILGLIQNAVNTMGEAMLRPTAAASKKKKDKKT